MRKEWGEVFLHVGHLLTLTTTYKSKIWRMQPSHGDSTNSIKAVFKTGGPDWNPCCILASNTWYNACISSQRQRICFAWCGVAPTGCHWPRRISGRDPPPQQRSRLRRAGTTSRALLIVLLRRSVVTWRIISGRGRPGGGTWRLTRLWRRSVGVLKSGAASRSSKCMAMPIKL